MSGAVQIVAVGARTPVGFSAESSAAAVRAGIGRPGPFPFIALDGSPFVVASDALLDPMIEGRARLVPLLRSAVDEVVGKLGPDADAPGSRRLWVALPEVRPGFSDEDARWVADALRADLAKAWPGLQVDVAGRGHAGAIAAVERVVRESAAAPDGLFLVAGADSWFHTETFLWLEREGRLAHAGVRNGFMPGEAAGCLALVGPRWRRPGSEPLAIVRGAATAREALLRDSETGSFGVGMSEALERAVGAAGLALPGDGVDAVFSDINGERYRSEEWGFVALRQARAFRTLAYQAPCDCWGDVGAASAALGAILAIQSFARGYARGPRALVLAGSDGGLRGAMVLQDPRSRKGRSEP